VRINTLIVRLLGLKSLGEADVGVDGFEAMRSADAAPTPPPPIILLITVVIVEVPLVMIRDDYVVQNGIQGIEAHNEEVNRMGRSVGGLEFLLLKL